MFLALDDYGSYRRGKRCGCRFCLSHFFQQPKRRGRGNVECVFFADRAENDIFAVNHVVSVPSLRLCCFRRILHLLLVQRGQSQSMYTVSWKASTWDKLAKPLFYSTTVFGYSGVLRLGVLRCPTHHFCCHVTRYGYQYCSLLLPHRCCFPTSLGRC